MLLRIFATFCKWFFFPSPNTQLPSKRKMRPKMKATSVAVVVTAGNGAIRVLVLKAKGEVWGSTNGTFLFINQDVVKEQNCCHIICFYFDGEKLSKDMQKTSEQRTSESESRLRFFLVFLQLLLYCSENTIAFTFFSGIAAEVGKKKEGGRCAAV